MGQLGCDMWHPVLRRCGNWIPSPSLREFVPFATFKKDTSNEAWVWVVHFGRWFKKSEKSFSKSFPWISVIFFFCFFVPLKIRVEKRHVHKHTENSCSTFLSKRSHIPPMENHPYPATLKGDIVSCCFGGYAASWIRDTSHQPSGLRSQDLQWSLCRPPIKALNFQIEVGCSYEVPSLWDPFGLLARPEGRSGLGGFFFCEKKNPFFVFQRFLFNKEKASNLFQIFPVSCVQMSIFKNVFKATPKSFYASFLQLEKKNSNLQWVVFLRETLA